MIFRWENFFNATMAFAKATSRSVIAVVQVTPALRAGARRIADGLACRTSTLAKVGVEGSNPFARSKT